MTSIVWNDANTTLAKHDDELIIECIDSNILGRTKKKTNAVVGN